jgi:hypothetical protein
MEVSDQHHVPCALTHGKNSHLAYSQNMNLRGTLQGQHGRDEKEEFTKTRALWDTSPCSLVNVHDES